MGCFFRAPEETSLMFLLRADCKPVCTPPVASIICSIIHRTQILDWIVILMLP